MRASELGLKHRPDELQQLVFGRSGGDASDEVVQIVKNETLIALIRRNADVVLDACMPAACNDKQLHHPMRESRRRGKTICNPQNHPERERRWEPSEG